MILENFDTPTKFRELIDLPKVILFPGHSPELTGARFQGLYEHILAVGLCVLVEKELIKLNIPVSYLVVPGDTKSKYLNEKVRIVNEVYKHDQNIIAIDIHFDSPPDLIDLSPHGSHCIHYPGSEKGEKLAESIQKRLWTMFPGRAKQTDARDDLRFLKKTRCPAILIETCFITNDNDTTKYLRKKKVVARAIADGIMSYAKSC